MDEGKDDGAPPSPVSPTGAPAPRTSTTSEGAPARKSGTPEAAPRTSTTSEGAPPRKSTTSEGAPPRTSTTSEGAPARKSGTPEPAPRTSGTSEVAPARSSEDGAPRTSEERPRPSLSPDRGPRVSREDKKSEPDRHSHTSGKFGDDDPDGVHGAIVKKTHEQELAEAAEHRKLWAMAATSVAHLIKEFSDKPIPNLEAIRQSFQPETPAEWMKRREAAAEAEIDEYSMDTSMVEASMEDSDVDMQHELFFDLDANDDDLTEFLAIDQKIVPTVKTNANRPSIKPSYAHQQTIRKKSIVQAQQHVEKSVSVVRKSVQMMGVGLEKKESVARGAAAAEDLEFPRPSKQAIEKTSSGFIFDELQEGSETEVTDAEEEATDVEDQGVRGSKADLDLKPVGSNADDDDWDYEDTANNNETGLIGGTDDDPDSMFQVTDVDYDINELAKGLESLLEDLQLEARITERYRYKLVNKFNLLLHALVGTHDREYEIMQHLQTKSKILTVLNNFVKTESEMTEKVDVKEEKSEEDLDQAMILDFHKTEGKLDDPGERQDEGLSIEEMNATTIRNTLLRQKNKIDVQEATKKIHVLKLKQKEFEKTLLTLHYSKMVKPMDLKKEIREARRLVNEVQVDISALHQEMGQLQQDIRVQEKSVNTDEKFVDRLELDTLTKQGEASVLQTKPILLQKEADRDAAKLEQLQDTYQAICQRQLDNMDDFRAFSGKTDKLEQELNTLIREEAKMAQQKKNAVRDVERFMGQMEALITREQIMIDKASQMNEKLTQANKMKKRIQEEQQKVFNEASKAVRVTLRLERSIKMASEAFLNARLAHEKMRTAFDAAKPSEEDSNWQRLSKMLEKEIANLKASLEKRLEESAIKGSMVDRLKQKLNELYDDQVGSGKELQELIRTTVRKRREREEKSEQCIKLDSQIQKFDNDIKMRELIIQDCQRSCKDLAKQMDVVQSKIEYVKLEKSAVINDIIINKEKLMEGREVYKGLENDIAVIGQRILDLEKELKEKHYQILNVRLARDSLRNDSIRSRDKFRYHRKQKDELLLGNKTLRRDLLRQKADIAVIRKEFEDALLASSTIAMSVRERLEEICTFMEYIHTYDKILLRGAGEITVREMELTKLCAVADELKKHVLVVKRNQPDETGFFSKIERLRKEFYEVTEKRRALEIQMNEDDNPERVREIRFDLIETRENIPALEKKLDSVEELLAYRDVIGLEKTLLENHVSKISNDLLSRALMLKETYAKDVKIKVNLRKNLALISRQIDGLISENSIASAQAETAETMYLHYRKELAQAEANFAAGLPPTKEMEEEWNHLQWRKEMLRRANQRPKGFLRQVQHKQGYQVTAEKIRAGCCKRRQLEKPEDSVLGWSFSAESAFKAYGPPPPPELVFSNSALNPHRSCIKRRESRESITNRPSMTPVKRKTSLQSIK